MWNGPDVPRGGTARLNGHQLAHLEVVQYRLEQAPGFGMTPRGMSTEPSYLIKWV